MRGIKKHLQNTWAPANMPNNEYLKLFNAQVTVLETLGGPLPIHPALVIKKLGTLGVTGSDIENPDPDLYTKAVNCAQKEYPALLTLSGANVTEFGGLRDKPENESLSGNNNYPKDQTELLHIMDKYKPEVARIVQNQQKNTEELAFI